MRSARYEARKIELSHYHWVEDKIKEGVGMLTIAAGTWYVLHAILMGWLG